MMTLEWAVLELKRKGYIVIVHEGEICGGTQWIDDEDEDEEDSLDDEFWISWAGSGDGWCSIIDGEREMHEKIEKAVERITKNIKPKKEGVFSA